MATCQINKVVLGFTPVNQSIPILDGGEILGVVEGADPGMTLLIREPVPAGTQTIPTNYHDLAIVKLNTDFNHQATWKFLGAASGYSVFLK